MVRLPRRLVRSLRTHGFQGTLQIARKRLRDRNIRTEQDRIPDPGLANAMRHFEMLYGRRPNTREIDHLKTLLPGLTTDQATGQFRLIVAGFERQLLSTPFWIRFSQSDVVYRSVEGAELALDRADVSVSLPILHGGQWEPHLTRFYRGHLKPGMTFIDVGANIGYFTVLASRLVGPEGRVIAFEPYSENCRLILLSLNKNRLGNVTLHPIGLSNQTGLAFFSTHLGTNGGFISSTESTLLDPNCTVIPTMRLDDLLANTPVNFLKMDAEGAEGMIVTGARKLIERNHPIITSEFGLEMLQRVSGVSGEAYLAYFQSLGYRIFMIDRATGAPGPIDDIGVFVGEYRDRIEDLAFIPTTGPNVIL
jgi:FkbM family methyltransferase